MSVRIALLADHPELLAPLATAYEREWPEWYGVHGNAMADLQARYRRTALPLGLVALEQDIAVGTVAIAIESVRSHRHVSPWIIGFWVESSRRNRGIGSKLLTAACNHASGQGIARLYAGTAAASSLFARDGWAVIDTGTAELGETITILSKTLAP